MKLSRRDWGARSDLKPQMLTDLGAVSTEDRGKMKKRGDWRLG